MSVERSELNVERSVPKGAVFLSYAREDTDAARRIAEALRGFGVEVWFDQAELHGGDAWDAKIRKQIRECALFVPLVSQQTEARAEGYFRREWKIAIDRTQDMGSSRTFIVPVVIDDTMETGADVPEEFMKFQWTRLADGEPSPEFVTQVKRLLETPKKPALKAGLPRPPTLPPEFRSAAREKKAEDGRRKSGLPGWTWGALTAVVVGVAVALFTTRTPGPAAPSLASRLPPPASALPRPPAGADAKSLAVLPFANLSADKENEFFADGMHDDLITALAKVRDLKVISRTSTLAYRDAASRNLKKIAAELGVATVLEGSVQRAGNRVRINVQLIDAQTDAHLWAETYNKDLTDIFTVQAALTQEIATALKANLTADERTLLARRPTEDSVAYDLYLRGRLLQQGFTATTTREQYEEVASLYEQAIARDPAFALPYTQLTLTYGVMYWFGSIEPTPERRARTRAALAGAQRLAPGSPETRYAQGGFAYLCDNDWPRALEEYRAAEAGLPNDAQLQYRIGLVHRRLGQMQAALSRFDRAVALNPNDQASITTQIETLNLLRRYPRVLELAGHYLAMYPGSGLLHGFHIQAQYESNGDRAAYLRAQAARPPAPQDKFGLEQRYADAMGRGDLVAAERILTDPRLTKVTTISGAIDLPVAFDRAQLALLRGDQALAKKQAAEAIRAFEAGPWSPRQESLVQFGLARTRALTRPAEDGARDILAGLREVSQRDAFLGYVSLLDAAETLALIGRREEALTCLRDYFSGPSERTPREVRENPLLASLKSDPRFEEILRSVKPL